MTTKLREAFWFNRGQPYGSDVLKPNIKNISDGTLQEILDKWNKEMVIDKELHICGVCGTQDFNHHSFKINWRTKSDNNDK